MNLRARTLAVCGAILLSLISSVSAQQQVARLPNGASSLREVYQDWTVNCSVKENTRTCSLLQDQLQKNGHRLLAIELQASSNGTAAATLLMPFGTLLDSGVIPQIDDQRPLGRIRFRTCLPSGCVAIFPIDAPTLDKMKSGSVLKLNVTTDAETQLTFPISLRGLTTALDRMTALSGH